jgi:hypothetical protein
MMNRHRHPNDGRSLQRIHTIFVIKIGDEEGEKECSDGAARATAVRISVPLQELY